MKLNNRNLLPQKGQTLSDLFVSHFRITIHLSIKSSLFLAKSLQFPIFMLTFAVVKRKLITHYQISYHQIRKEIANGTERDFPKSEGS